MLYECIECGHSISEDAWRCPNCGAREAGANALYVHSLMQRGVADLAKDQTDPGWRARADANAELSSNRGKWKDVWILYYAYLLPLIAVGSIWLWFSEMSWQIIFMAIPAVNWILVIVALLANDTNGPVIFVMLGWAIVGAILAAVTMPTSKEFKQ